MKKWGLRAGTVVALLALALGAGSTGAVASPGRVVSETTQVVAEEIIDPSNSIRLTDAEVRELMPIDRMIAAGKTVKEIRQYFPEKTPAEIKKLQHEAELAPKPMIVEANCSLSTEFYGVLRSDGSQYCYAYAGSTNTYINAVSQLCPGNNMGRTYYATVSNAYYWSPWRGPVNPLTTCYRFSVLVSVYIVQIA
jgi:hypothetical protein